MKTKTKLFSELSSQEYERLLGRAMHDEKCMSAFIQTYEEDFMLWTFACGIDQDYACDHELDYIEDNEDLFGEFATVYYNAKGK